MSDYEQRRRIAYRYLGGLRQCDRETLAHDIAAETMLRGRDIGVVRIAAIRAKIKYYRKASTVRETELVYEPAGRNILDLEIDPVITDAINTLNERQKSLVYRYLEFGNTDGMSKADRVAFTRAKHSLRGTLAEWQTQRA